MKRWHRLLICWGILRGRKGGALGKRSPCSLYEEWHYEADWHLSYSQGQDATYADVPRQFQDPAKYPELVSTRRPRLRELDPATIRRFTVR